MITKFYIHGNLDDGQQAKESNQQKQSREIKLDDILKASSEGISADQIAQMFKINKSTVDCLLNRFNTDGTLSGKSRRTQNIGENVKSV